MNVVQAFPKTRPKSLFGKIAIRLFVSSIVYIPVGGALGLTMEKPTQNYLLFIFFAICFGSFICGLIGLLRFEKPLAPAFFSVLATGIPAVMFSGALFGWLTS